MLSFLCSVVYIIVCPLSFFFWPLYCQSIFDLWPLYFANQIGNCSEWNLEFEPHTILSIKHIMDLLRFAEIEPHAIILIKLIMDLLRFAEIEPHDIISIKFIMDKIC